MNNNIYYLTEKRAGKGQVQALETTRMLRMDINEADEKFDHPCEDLWRKSAKEFGAELTGKLKSCEGCARATERSSAYFRSARNICRREILSQPIWTI